MINNKIYYLTRSYYPYQKGGGPLMRSGAVRYLRELGWDVTVVMPNYESKELITDGEALRIPFEREHIPRLAAFLQRIGLYEDYLDKWVVSAFNYLKDKLQSCDIVFATSGGELGMIKLGSMLKEKVDCRFVVNFRDPLDFGYMNGLRKNNVLHVSRKKEHEKYIKNSDLILTSSQYYADVLKKQFLYLEDRIHNNYFGYVSYVDVSRYKKRSSRKLRVAYSGIMSNAQKPEILYEAYRELGNKNIEIYYIGNKNNYSKLHAINDDNVHFIDFMPHDKFLKFMCENIDVGFVSLVNDYYGACVPSKIYEYLNLGLPILGALPKGDGRDIINKNGYGVACSYDDLEKLQNTLSLWTNKEVIDDMQEVIARDKEKWAMKNRINEVDLLLRESFLS